MAYGDFNYLSRRKPSDEVFRVKVFNIVKNPEYGYHRDLLQMVYKRFDKKSIVASTPDGAIKSEIKSSN